MITLKAPLAEEDVRRLRSGDMVYISGTVYTARDAAHLRMLKALERGEEMPFALAGSIVYYSGPCPAPPGRPVGACGPTTSGRMDAMTPPLLEHGLKAMIGKGERDASVVEAIKRCGAVYLAAVGGAGAYLSNCVKKAEVIAYPELGPEAVRRLEVENLPCIVAIDSFGHSLYAEGRSKYARTGGKDSL